MDELILNLFNVPDSGLNIIERSQMEALLSELKLGTAGLLNPQTTKQLGEISGVQALIIGTITVLGDRIRINARLVETDTARAISEAAISIPRTGAINTLLEQSVVGGPMCGGSTAGGIGGFVVSSMPGSGSPPPTKNMKNSFFAEGPRFFVQNISRSEEKKFVNLVLGVVNETKYSLPVIFIKPSPAMIDNKGNQIFVKNVTGIQGCNRTNTIDFDLKPDGCIKFRRSFFTTLTPNVLQTVLLRFVIDSEDENAKLDGNYVSFSSRVQIIIDEKNKNTKMYR